MLRFRTAVACVLAVVLCGLAIAQPPPQPWIDFSTGFPKAGSVAGEISASVDWKNCANINEVQVSIYTTDPKLGKVQCGPTAKKTSGGGGILLPSGNFPASIATGKTQGTPITSGLMQVFDGAFKPNIIVSYAPAVTNGCTVP
ncbi:MAG: hypothetical protein K2X87_28735 [Gemmataceae bacterium]|nr:hypothetical protein [Gemmataceae bacterium]